jgi:hypothetical protein
MTALLTGNAIIVNALWLMQLPACRRQGREDGKTIKQNHANTKDVD